MANRSSGSNIYQDTQEDEIYDVLYLKSRLGHGGYNPNYFFNEPGSKKIPVCTSCNGIVRDSHRVVECDHVFCKKCLDNLSACPEDSRVFQDVKIEKMKQVDKHVLQRRIHCPLVQRGCDWRGKLSEVEGHIKRCGFFRLKCTNGCPIVYQRMDREKHEVTCTAKEQECKYCGKRMAGKDLMNHETSECSETPLECPHHCSRGSIPRKEYNEHTIEQCLAMIVQCPFMKFGCYTALMKEDMDAHVEKEQARHMGYLCDKVSILEGEKEECVNKIEELSSESEAQKTFNQQLQYELQSLHQQMMAISLDTSVLHQDAAASNGTITWHVPAIKARWNRNEMKLTSKPLYSAPKGYKFVMEIDTCVAEEANYLSVYVRPMRGEFDLMMIWPFTGEFTFSVLNQYEDRNHHSSLMVLDEDTYFDRVNQDPGPLRLGIDHFVSENDLYQYSRYGGVYFRLEVKSKFVLPLWLI